MEKPVGKAEASLWTHTFDAGGQQVEVTLPSALIEPTISALAGLGLEPHYKIMEKCLRERAKVLLDETHQCNLELGEISMCLTAIERSKSMITGTHQQLKTFHDAVGGTSKHTGLETKAQDVSHRASRDITDVVDDLTQSIMGMDEETQRKLQALRQQLEVKPSSATVPNGTVDVDVPDIKDVVNVTVELIEAIKVYDKELLKKAESLKQTLDGCRMTNTHPVDNKHSSNTKVDKIQKNIDIQTDSKQ